LQKVGTRSAKRALRRVSGRQARFQRHTNHCLSKTILADAERGRCFVVLEDLGGNDGYRVKARKHQRARMANWGFYQLRQMIEYKAALKGVAVVQPLWLPRWRWFDSPPHYYALACGGAIDSPCRAG